MLARDWGLGYGALTPLAAEEARDILRQVMSDTASPRDLAAAIRARVTAAARAELKLPARDPLREPPQLGRQPR